jgi:ATP-dependent DNA helicase RecG
MTLQDLLYHFPTRYEHSGDQKTIAGIASGNDVILYGTIRKPQTRKTWKTRRAIAEAYLEDGTGKVKLMWFNQPYIAKMYEDGQAVKVVGRVEGTSSLYVANPEIERVSSIPIGGSESLFHTDQDDELFAIYPETQGITSRWFRHAAAKLIREGIHDELFDPVPDEVLKRYHLPSLATALVWIHQPKEDKDATSARKRFAFEEVFVIQTAKQLARASVHALPTVPIEHGDERAHDFIERLPFTLTTTQNTAIKTILGDMREAPAMSRLLEGDVGSGKTAVAAATAYACVTSSPPNRPSATLQVAYMAPTEILAQQHYESFVELFKHLPIQLGLITGSGCKKFPSKVDPSGSTKISKAQLLKWVANGEIAMLIGTHALIQKNVQFRDLAYVIVDEQHRFGTNQRKALVQKDGTVPHLLSMSATPIPRTLALTLYGDLDLTVLDEMPKGRKPIITEVVPKSGRIEMYTTLKRELDTGRQAYVICPRIDEPDPTKEMAVQAKSALAEADRLKRTDLKGYRICVLHGKMKPAEKDQVMEQFLQHELDVLVATSVVEVGVNVPNATVIVIEGAERFGLAQLHQLRGRVVRSSHQAYCFVLTTHGQKNARLTSLAKAKNGFELAELDLKTRGPGELYGRSQSGLSDVGMEALKNLKLVEAAHTEAQTIVSNDPTLKNHPILLHAVEHKQEKLHFE